MRRTYRILIAALLVCCEVLSCCGCGSPDRGDEARAACETFCESVKAGDTAKILTYLNGEASEEALNGLINPPEFNQEQTAVSQAIKESTTYSIQDPVYDKNAKTATVFVVWNQADLSADEVINANSIEEFKTAVTSVPAKYFTLSLTVDLSGEFASIQNPMETVYSVYAYNTVDLNIMPGALSDYFVKVSPVLAPKGVYSNVDAIGIRVDFQEAVDTLRMIPDVYYTVARNGEVIYTSDLIDFFGTHSLRLDYTTEMTSAGDLNEDGFITDGSYMFMVFDSHSKEICRCECTVENVLLEKEEFQFEKYKKDHYLSNLVYDIKDSELMATSFIYKTGWWDYDGTSVGKSAFASNTKTLGFSLAVSSTNDKELYFDYYFSKEADFSDIGETGPAFSSSLRPTIYEDQACYDIDYTPEEMKPGFYGLVVYGDAAKKHILFTAACIVVEEKSGDVID